MCTSDPGRLKYPANTYKPPATFVDQADLVQFNIGDQPKIKLCFTCGEPKSEHPNGVGVHCDSSLGCFMCGGHHQELVRSSVLSHGHF
jgi:hypothetical protein